MKYNKENYHEVLKLYSKQDWLIKKEKELEELIVFCENKEEKILIFSLLERFHYLQNERLSLLLNKIADFIISSSGFDVDTTQILSITYDDEADSSRKVLDMMKVPLFQKGWKKLKTVNHYRSSIKNHKNGRNQIILIDEFIGTGKTIRNRIKQLRNDINGYFELKCCFLAGIKSAIDNLQNEGIEIFCPLQLKKGISEFYCNEVLTKTTNEMLSLESKLASKINEKELIDYSFGYGHAEALYSLEGCCGNTPNSVFPIFWWLHDNNEQCRNTLLTRFEIGF